VAAGLDQRIEPAHLLGHLAVEQPLAQAVGGNRDPVRIGPADQFGQHEAREREQREPGLAGPGHAAELVDRPGRDPACGLQQLVDRGFVFVQHLERIADTLHVEPRQRPPAAANEEQPTHGTGHALAQRLHALADVLLHRLGPGDVLQLQWSERGGRAVRDLAAGDPGEFHRRAAHVADETVRLGPAEQDALGREAGLFLAGSDVELEARLALDTLAEGRAVLGVADRGRGDRDQAVRAHAVGERDEPVERGHGAALAVLVEPPRLGKPDAETGHDLLVVEIGRAARHAVEDDEAHGVRADVDHADPAEP
jgi:hypothetical protein